MGHQRFKRPLDTRSPSSVPDVRGEFLSFYGLKLRAPLTTTGFLQSASSAGVTGISPGGVLLMAANTSAGAVDLNIATLSTAWVAGDSIFVTANVPTSSAGAVLRLPTTDTFFEGTTGTRDSLRFNNGFQSALVVCLTTARFIAVGASTSMYAAST